jgi:hypothetical protein
MDEVHAGGAGEPPSHKKSGRGMSGIALEASVN